MSYNEEVDILNANTCEVTINLHPTNPNIIVHSSAQIEIKNNKPRITVYTNNPVILNNKKNTSVSSSSEIEIKLNSKTIEVQ